MPNDLAYPRPTAKRLVLSLLSVPQIDEVSARQCARWGELFAIEAAAMRVALGRLVQGQLLTLRRRGVYAIGPKGKTLSDTARSWVAAETRVARWDGRWLLVSTGHLGRRNKTLLRARERALRLEGLAEWQGDLWCRPANLREPITATRERLLTLGLDEEALLLRADRLLGADSAPAELWPREALERRYDDLTRAMEDSRSRVPRLADAAAARETFLIGETVIRQINGDPLLPDEMIDASARRTMHEAMVAYDAVGREAWERFHAGSCP